MNVISFTRPGGSKGGKGRGKKKSETARSSGASLHAILIKTPFVWGAYKMGGH